MDVERREAERALSHAGNQRVARVLRDEKGVELTPDQVGEIRRRAFARLRAALAEKGIEAPADDVGFAIWVRRTLKPNGGSSCE